MVQIIIKQLQWDEKELCYKFIILVTLEKKYIPPLTSGLTIIANGQRHTIEKIDLVDFDSNSIEVIV